MKDTSTNVSAKAVMTAIKPPWFVFDMKARGALTPGVAAEEGAEAGADMLGSRDSANIDIRTKDARIVVLITEIAEGSTVGKGGKTQQTKEARAKQ
jgi:hypothetical protein